jgi:hypothetical protein
MNEFTKKVEQMRTLQKRYFKERDSFTLAACKKAERDVDSYIEMLKQKEEKQQKRLFDGNN